MASLAIIGFAVQFGVMVIPVVQANITGPHAIPRRIAVSGFAGSGKTSLCAALGERLAVSVLPDHMEPIEAASAPRLAGPEGADRENRADLYEALIAWHERRKMAYRQSPAFVADRWEADVLAWSMIEFPPPDDAAVDSMGFDLIGMVQSAAAEIDCIVMMPFQMPFMSSGSSNAAGLVRRFGFTRLMLWEAAMTGIIKRFTTIPVMRVPAGSLTVDQRVEAVLSGLASPAARRT